MKEIHISDFNTRDAYIDYDPLYPYSSINRYTTQGKNIRNAVMTIIDGDFGPDMSIYGYYYGYDRTRMGYSQEDFANGNVGTIRELVPGRGAVPGHGGYSDNALVFYRLRFSVYEDNRGVLRLFYVETYPQLLSLCSISIKSSCDKIFWTSDVTREPFEGEIIISQIQAIYNKYTDETAILYVLTDMKDVPGEQPNPNSFRVPNHSGRVPNHSGLYIQKISNDIFNNIFNNIWLFFNYAVKSLTLFRIAGVDVTMASYELAFRNPGFDLGKTLKYSKPEILNTIQPAGYFTDRGFLKIFFFITDEDKERSDMFEITLFSSDFTPNIGD
jgi:hypothetical protein